MEAQAKKQHTYHSSPSKNRSEGMVSRINWGRASGDPFREKNTFFLGCQNPLTPSYFSNIHLPCLKQRHSKKHIFTMRRLPVGAVDVHVGKKTSRGRFTYVFDISMSAL